MNHYFKLIRPVNCLITFISVVVAAFIASADYFPPAIVLLAALSASLAAAAGNVINDYYDIDIDKIAHPNRPLAAGKITKESAVVIYIFLSCIAIVASLLINLIAFGIVFSAMVLLFFYSMYLKKLVLFSNYVVAWLTGMVFIYGGIVVGNVSAAIIPALFAFFINFIREIVKDIQDIKGDLNAGLVTFPAKYGTDKASVIIIVLTFALVLLTFHPFIYSYYKIEYFIVVMIIVNPLLVYFLKLIQKNYSKNNLQRMSAILKFNMVIGLLAIYLGK